jgi:hypothetical protein
MALKGNFISSVRSFLYLLSFLGNKKMNNKNKIIIINKNLIIKLTYKLRINNKKQKYYLNKIKNFNFKKNFGFIFI